MLDQVRFSRKISINKINHFYFQILGLRLSDSIHHYAIYSLMVSDILSFSIFEGTLLNITFHHMLVYFGCTRPKINKPHSEKGMQNMELIS